MHIHHVLFPFVLVLSAMLLISPPEAEAQTPAGTEFIVPLPAVMSTYERNDTSFKFRVEILSSRKTKISVRWAGSGLHLVQDAILNAGERLVVMRPMFEIFSILQSDVRGLSDSINTRAFWITSDEPISVHAIFDKSYRSETYTIMPTSAYDTSYTVVNYSGYAQGSDRGGVIISAAENNTQVTITPSVALYSKPERLKGVPFTITLQKNQVYQAMANEAKVGQLADMTGTIIKSTRPVGVLSFMKATNVPITRRPQDTSVDPLSWKEPGYSAKTIINPQLSDGRAGTLFYALPFARQTRTRIRLVATQFNTTFTMNGLPVTMYIGNSKGESTFNTGAYLDTVITGPTIIEASKPVVAMQLAYSSDLTTYDSVVVRQDLPDVTVKIPYGDPMMVFLPPVDRYLRSAQWISPMIDTRPAKSGNPPVVFFWEHYATIIAPAEAQGNVTLDGEPLDLNISFPGGTYRAAIVRVTPAPHKVESDYPVNVIAHGFSWNDSYGMNAGESVRAIGKLGIDTLRITSCDEEMDTTFTLANLGNAILRIDSVAASGVDVRLVSPHPASLPQAVIAGRSRDIVIAVRMPAPGTYTGTLRIYTDANNRRIFDLPIIATRDSAQLDIPGVIDFGVIPSSATTYDTTVVIRNNGTKPITLTTVDLLGDGFQILSPALPHTIAPGKSDSLKIRITPANSLREAKLTLRGTPCLNGREVDLRGIQGGGANLLVKRSIDYPTFTCTAPAPVDSILEFRSVGEEPVEIISATITGDPNNEFSLLDNPVALSPIQPLDTMRIRVRFAPKMAGPPRNASLEITTNANNARSFSVALTGRLDTTWIAPSLDTISFDRRRSCDQPIDTAITLTNGGTIPDTITAIDLGGVSAYSVTPSLPIIVHPGVAQTLRVRFAPTADGTFNTTLSITGSVCNSRADIALSGRRVAPALELGTETLRFDTVFACDAKPLRRKIGIRNSGELIDTVTSVSMAGNTAFSLAPLSTPIVLLPGQSDSIEVIFTPAAADDYVGVLVLDWGPCAGSAQVDVAALVVEPQVDISASELDFGPVDVGGSLRQSIVVQNTGRMPRRITEIDFGGATAFRIISPQIPVTIPAGGSATIEVEFAPTEIDSLDATATISFAAPCPTEQGIAVKGVGIGEEFIRAGLTLDAPRLSGAVDATVTIPISITSSANLAAAEPASLRFVLRHNYTMLAPLTGGITSPVPGMGVTVIRDEIVGDERELEIELSGGVFPAQGEIVRIDRLVLIGNAEMTLLAIDSVSLALRQKNASVAVTTDNGEFHVEGLCITGGGRMVRLGGSALKHARPNPFREATTIDIELLNDAPVELVVLNGAGVEVSKLLEGELAAGTYTVSFDGSQLPSGLYFCELRSREERIRRTLILVQ